MCTNSLANAKSSISIGNTTRISRLEHQNINSMMMSWKGYKVKLMKYQRYHLLRLTEKLRRMKSSSSIKRFNERTSRKSWAWPRLIWKTFKMKIMKLWRTCFNQWAPSMSMLWVCHQMTTTSRIWRSTNLKRSSNMALNLHHTSTQDLCKIW